MLEMKLLGKITVFQMSNLTADNRATKIHVIRNKTSTSAAICKTAQNLGGYQNDPLDLRPIY